MRETAEIISRLPSLALNYNTIARWVYGTEAPTRAQYEAVGRACRRLRDQGRIGINRESRYNRARVVQPTHIEAVAPKAIEAHGERIAIMQYMLEALEHRANTTIFERDFVDANADLIAVLQPLADNGNLYAQQEITRLGAQLAEFEARVARSDAIDAALAASKAGRPTATLERGIVRATTDVMAVLQPLADNGDSHAQQEIARLGAQLAEFEERVARRDTIDAARAALNAPK